MPLRAPGKVRTSGGDLPVAAADKPAAVQPALVAHSEPVRAEAPARRVLPSLVPMFSLSVEPEASEVREVPAVERLPRVRRPKEVVKREQQPAAKAVAARPAPLSRRFSPQVNACDPRFFHGDGTRRRSASLLRFSLAQHGALQQAVTLRPGERWKRRLPRVLW